ncbi:MAG: hypothetical protein BIFFINMI_00929 [Phycisphaerae bacterium]|nr:hypothetical protein [Phycisphaerae bacterium]
MIATKTAKVAPATVRCAIYTRKSSEEGLDQEFNSLDAQRESAEAYVASQKSEGWACLPDRYDDGGFSGGDMERPAVGRLMADVEAGKIDCVVVYKVDRLSRSLLDFARIMAVFDQRHIAFVSVTQNFNTSTPMGRLVLNILLSFAQFEREIIGERIRDKKLATARKGMWTGGIPVLGYDIDRSTGSPRLVVNPAEAARVRAMFGLYLEKGSLLPAVQELANRGWTTKVWTTKAGKPRGGTPFDKNSLYGLLTNPVYAGKIRHKADLYDGEHEAIIPPDRFKNVQATLEYNGRTGGPQCRNRHGALLRGLLFCKACGRAMVHTFTAKGDKRYRYYACTHAIKSGWKTCPSKSLPAGEIERVVVDQIRCIGQDAGLRADVLAQARRQTEAEMARLDAERRDLDRQLARDHAEIRKLATKGPASSATAGRIAELHERVLQAETRLGELRDQVAAAERDQVGEADLDAAVADFDNVWGTLSPREQAKVLALLIASVEYDAAEGSVSIAFHQAGIKALAADQTQEDAA